MKIIIVLTFIFSVLRISAQSTITGKVIDDHNFPLEGSTVVVVELNKGTVCDKEGKYTITNLPHGKLTVKYSFIGYANHIETVVLTLNSVQEINVTLKLSPIEAEEVVVSSGYVTSQHSDAVKIDLLKLNSHKVIQSPNIMDIISTIPGVDMISKGSGVSKPVIRGLGMDNILVLNNGSRYENYQYSNHHPLGIDEFGIDQVEVIKGPASLMYGSDAIGGVLNFIKEKPAPVNSWQGDYNLQYFSNSLGIQNNLGVKASGKKIFGGIRIGQKSHEDYLQGGGDYVPNTRFNENSVKAFAGLTHSLGTNKLYYEYSIHKIGLAEDEAIENISERGRKPEIFYQQFNTHFAQLQNKLYLNQYKIEINSSFQNTELIHFAEKNIREIDMRLNTLNYEAKMFFPSSEKSEYIIGYQGYAQNNLNVNNAEVTLLPDAGIFNHSLFGLIQYTFRKKFKPQLGLRYDLKKISTDPVGAFADSTYRAPVDKNYQNASGSIGMTYMAWDDVFIRANIATAYRTPNLAELTSFGQHELRFEVGDSKLNPQKSVEYDASLHVHKNHFTFDLAAFFNDVNHYIFIDPTGDTTSTGVSIYQYQQSDAYLYGGEAAFHFHPQKHDWFHLELEYSMVYGEQKSGLYLPFIPAHKVEGELRLMKKKLIFINDAFIGFTNTYRFKQNCLAADETYTSDYWLLDLNVGGEIMIGKQTVVIRLGINNLFDKKYIDHLSTLKEVGFFNPGRNIYLSLKVPFGSL